MAAPLCDTISSNMSLCHMGMSGVSATPVEGSGGLAVDVDHAQANYGIAHTNRRGVKQYQHLF